MITKHITSTIILNDDVVPDEIPLAETFLYFRRYNIQMLVDQAHLLLYAGNKGNERGKAFNQWYTQFQVYTETEAELTEIRIFFRVFKERYCPDSVIPVQNTFILFFTKLTPQLQYLATSRDSRTGQCNGIIARISALPRYGRIRLFKRNYMDEERRRTWSCIATLDVEAIQELFDHEDE
jgi:hypothetical protein